MEDPILDEIWRVRAELVKKYGGLRGFLDHIQKLDQARLRREKRRRSKNQARRKAKSTR